MQITDNKRCRQQVTQYRPVSVDNHYNYPTQSWGQAIAKIPEVVIFEKL